MPKSATGFELLSKLWPTPTPANSYQEAKINDCMYLKPDYLLVNLNRGIGLTSMLKKMVKLTADSRGYSHRSANYLCFAIGQASETVQHIEKAPDTSDFGRHGRLQADLSTCPSLPAIL